jgi:hypothetical protein
VAKFDWIVSIVEASNQWKAKKATYEIDKQENSKENDSEEKQLSSELSRKAKLVEAPVWVPDAQSSTCGICSEQWSLMRRRVSFSGKFDGVYAFISSIIAGHVEIACVHLVRLIEWN